MATLRQLALPCAVGAGLILIAVPAAAQEKEIVVTGELKVPAGYEAVKKVVNIGDLDLTTDKGAATMKSRVTAAVNSLCARPANAMQWQIQDSRKCRDFAWKSARPQMDAALKQARGT